MAGSLVSTFEEAAAAEDLFLNVGDAFAYSEFADEDRWENNVLSSCSHNSNWQPSKLRARDAFCPADSSPPLRIPELPDFSDIDNAINVPDIEILVVAEELTRPDKPYLVIVVSDVSISANEPEYYCHKYLARPPAPSLFSIPVCSEYNSWWTRQYGVYSEISPATLLTPTTTWACPESQFFCCLSWFSDAWDPLENEDVGLTYRELLALLSETYDPISGKGLTCVNLKRAGWGGYNTDKEGVIMPADQDSDLPFDPNDIDW